MAIRKPLVLVDNQVRPMPDDDWLDVPIAPAASISTDPGNALSLGADGKLYVVPQFNSVNW